MIWLSAQYVSVVDVVEPDVNSVREYIGRLLHSFDDQLFFFVGIKK